MRGLRSDKLSRICSIKRENIACRRYQLAVPLTIQRWRKAGRPSRDGYIIKDRARFSLTIPRRGLHKQNSLPTRRQFGRLAEGLLCPWCSQHVWVLFGYLLTDVPEPRKRWASTGEVTRDPAP